MLDPLILEHKPKTFTIKQIHWIFFINWNLTTFNELLIGTKAVVLSKLRLVKVFVIMVLGLSPAPPLPHSYFPHVWPFFSFSPCVCVCLCPHGCGTHPGDNHAQLQSIISSLRVYIYVSSPVFHHPPSHGCFLPVKFCRFFLASCSVHLPS